MNDQEIQVLKVLGQNKSMPSTITLRNITMRVALPIDTVRDAISVLESKGLVKSRKEYFYLTRDGLMRVIDQEW